MRGTMSMPANELTRQGFLRIGLSWLGVITLPFGLGCPADDTGDEGADSGDEGSTTSGADDSTGSFVHCEMDPSVMIATNHGHVLVVPLADVVAGVHEGVEVTYDIQGTADHSHTVTLTPNLFVMIQQSGSVVPSSLDNGHNHQVTIACE
jgi:hypothetical protein